MMRNAMILLLVLSAPAAAQDWSHGACYEGGIYFPARAFGKCVSSDKHGFVQTMPPANLIDAIGLLRSPNVSNTSVVRSCPDGRELVMRSSGSYGCAADVTDPK